MKICRQHDSHGSTPTQQFPLSQFVVFTALYTEKKTAKKLIDLKKFSTTTSPGIEKQPCFCEMSYINDKLFVIKTSPVDLMQLGSKMYFPESTEKNVKEKQNQPIQKKFRIDSNTQYT